jgi:hypothetical protein
MAAAFCCALVKGLWSLGQSGEWNIAPFVALSMPESGRR